MILAHGFGYFSPQLVGPIALGLCVKRQLVKGEHVAEESCSPQGSWDTERRGFEGHVPSELTPFPGLLLEVLPRPSSATGWGSDLQLLGLSGIFKIQTITRWEN